MIYLIKKICTSCNMKIELMDDHFGMELRCPNCDADISIPDINKIAEEKAQLAKQLEELKNDTNFTQTNTIAMGRPGQTLKVNNATPPPDLAEKLKKEQQLTEKLKKEEEVLVGKLKGLQTANLSMNEELKSLREQKSEFDKSLDTVKKLQKELGDKDNEISRLQEKLKKYSALTQNLNDISSVGVQDVVSKDTASSEEMAETMAAPVQEMAETMAAPAQNVLEETLEVPKDNMESISKDKFDETLQVTMEAVQVTERECSECGKEYPFTAKFCPHCNARNENFSE